jgi:hypothetical protein
MIHCGRFKKFVWLVLVVFTLTGTAQAYEMARIMTSGKVNVYRDGNLIQVLRENAPLPVDALLKPEGKCGVRLQNVYLVAEDGSEFGVPGASLPVELALKKGMIYFAVNQATGQMVFQTPAGTLTAQQFQIQSAAGGILKGFISVNEGVTTLGVIEGGVMVVSVPGGEQAISPGNQITLAQADILRRGANRQQEEPAQPPKESRISDDNLISIGILAAFAGGAILIISDNDSSSPSPSSPAAP